MSPVNGEAKTHVPFLILIVYFTKNFDLSKGGLRSRHSGIYMYLQQRLAGFRLLMLTPVYLCMPPLKLPLRKLTIMQKQVFVRLHLVSCQNELW